IQRWACTKRLCKSFFKLSENGDIVFSVLNHDHDKDDTNILTRQKVSNKLKRKALDDPYEKPCKILHKELRQGDISSLTTADTTLIRKNIHYARSSIIPKLPTNLEELHLALTNLGEIKTNRDEIFLFINNSVKNIVAFSTQSNLKHLTECDVLYVDGTFKSCPRPFYQLFIIHGAKNANCIIYADFEEAIHTAISEIFPEVIRKGYRFHLGQSMWRKIQSLGLYLMAIKPNNQQLHDFCNFFERNYVLPNSKFPPSLWAEFSNSLQRTTNSCESFHSKLNKILKNVQTDVYVKIRSSNVTKKQREVLEKEDYINDIMHQFQNKMLTRLEFIEKLAYKNLPVGF
ncbi:uncharacterized protein LOC132924821, partial [Rhopalosiphum padi]|uniref:uncharacterized protein LOC132924821 n=1 Tax=Rhopalosiphum padi TaxID=40932 RepID=UPI00298E8E9D